jgi:hypothetical protein
MILSDMQKLESPFERKEMDGKYQCVPIIKPEYNWVWTEDCLATDKLDGTNVSVHILNGKIKTIMNRTNPIDIWKAKEWFYVGVRNAMERNYFVPEQYDETQLFGELIGPRINGNPYELETALWVPFDYIKQNYVYKFWQKDIVPECKEKTDEEIFTITSDVFKGLWSLYKRAHGIKGEVTEKTVFEKSPSAEGIVFYNSKTGERAKLRRDMFSWYLGRNHGLAKGKEIEK